MTKVKRNAKNRYFPFKNDNLRIMLFKETEKNTERSNYLFAGTLEIKTCFNSNWQESQVL